MDATQAHGLGNCNTATKGETAYLLADGDALQDVGQVAVHQLPALHHQIKHAQPSQLPFQSKGLVNIRVVELRWLVTLLGRMVSHLRPLVSAAPERERPAQHQVKIVRDRPWVSQVARVKQGACDDIRSTGQAKWIFVCVPALIAHAEGSGARVRADVQAPEARQATL